MIKTTPATSIPAQNTEQNESEILANIIETVALMGNRKNLTPKEKAIKALLKTIKKLDRLKVEHDKLNEKYEKGGDK